MQYKLINFQIKKYPNYFFWDGFPACPYIVRARNQFHRIGEFFSWKSLIAYLRRSVQLAEVLFICVALVIWSTPVQADTIINQADNSNLINPKLETEVLQIIRNHPEVVREALQAESLQKQQQQQQAQYYIKQQIRENPSSIIGESPVTGATQQKIVLIEFSDFQCPYCAKAHQTLKQFMARHQDEVTLVYKHYPLTSIHPEAIPAAKAAWAANKQGKFWQYQDALFAQQDKLGEKLYVALAKKLKLDLSEFNQQRNSQQVSAVIEKDQQIAEKLGIKGTPFFFINGETFAGAVTLSEMESILSRVKVDYKTVLGNPNDQNLSDKMLNVDPLLLKSIFGNIKASQTNPPSTPSLLLVLSSRF
ncbi:MAG: DsbA family protein [Nostoc sp.]|uniref:DsbA family protein n=1 Tax=Nostoc sp. TaxID=1180 RepID=UPI002FF64D03